MNILVVLMSLLLLMYIAYKGFSVILLAPILSLLAVILTDPVMAPGAFSGIFMAKLASFIKLYFPIFLLGAVFGKLIEISGFSNALVQAIINKMGIQRAILSVVSVGALLTYGGVSLFVVVFAVYPFASELFKSANIPKRLLPGTIALGAFSFTMDSLPGSPQIQNIIPTSFFMTTTWAAPVLGIVGSIFIFTLGLTYLYRESDKAKKNSEGYTSSLDSKSIESKINLKPTSAWLAILPLLIVAVTNILLSILIHNNFGRSFTIRLSGLSHPINISIPEVSAIWAIQGALCAGIVFIILVKGREIYTRINESSKTAVQGAMLACLNTASEYGFGAVISVLPGFIIIKDFLAKIPNPLINEAVTITTLSGLTGSASGGLSIALAAIGENLKQLAIAEQIPFEVLHRVASMASGGMDTLPHNGAVITLLTVCGLTHRQAYKDIFVITLIKTAAVFFVILFYMLTGIY